MAVPYEPGDTEDELEEKACEDGGKYHCYDAIAVAEAEFIRGNAKCRRSTRFLLYCATCGHTLWVDDPDQPEIK